MAEKLKDQELLAYEKKLEELSLFMGEVFKDVEARKELFDFAKLKQNENDIDYNLRLLFESNQNPHTRIRSAIVNAFYQTAENYRLKNDIEPNDLADFIVKNDIGVLAPYLNESFEHDQIGELTVSWWTEEMEIAELEKNPDWEGETPGYKVSLKGNSDIGKIDFQNSIVKVITNDEYAKKNPTVVFGKFDSFDEEQPRSDISNYLSRIENIENSANCSDLTSNSIVRLTMPKFRLTKSIRSWPHPDKVSLCIVLGATSGSNAISYRPFFEEKVTRWHANNDHWITSPATFIVNNWQARQLDMAFVVFNRRPYAGRQSFTASVTVKNGDVESTQTATVGGWRRSQRYFETVFERCGTIDDPFRNKGAGREPHNGVMYGIERFRNFEFILVPEITL